MAEDIGLVAESLSLGSQRGCTTSAGVASCWGFNAGGQVGVLGQVVVPTPRLLGSGGWLELSLGSLRSCGRTVGGLFCWGFNSDFFVGFPGPTQAYTTPTPLDARTTFSAISGGFGVSCAIDDVAGARSIHCWGANLDGQLGRGSNSISAALGEIVDPGLKDWQRVVAGGRFVCALRGAGDLYCWGDNIYGQLGLGATGDRSTPQRVGAASDWVDLALARGSNLQHACGIRQNGAERTLWCWGNGTEGQLGFPVVSSATREPTRVTMRTDFAAVRTGETFTCALTLDGEVLCTGTNQRSQLGIGQYPTRSFELLPVAHPPGVVFTALEAGTLAACAIASTGRVFCWGDVAPSLPDVRFMVLTPSLVSLSNLPSRM